VGFRKPILENLLNRVAQRAAVRKHPKRLLCLWKNCRTVTGGGKKRDESRRSKGTAIEGPKKEGHGSELTQRRALRERLHPVNFGGKGRGNEKRI